MITKLKNKNYVSHEKKVQYKLKNVSFNYKVINIHVI